MASKDDALAVAQAITVAVVNANPTLTAQQQDLLENACILLLGHFTDAEGDQREAAIVQYKTAP